MGSILLESYAALGSKFNSIYKTFNSIYKTSAVSAT
jgi:hypothetical protein